MNLYRDESSNPKYNAQRNLAGRTHYVDNDTLRWHKSRVISTRCTDGGLLFAIITSDALDMRLDGGQGDGRRVDCVQLGPHGFAGALEAFTTLRKWLKPGDTVYTVLDHVSRSGMSRNIRVVLMKCEDGEARDLHPNYAVLTLMGYRRAKRGDGFVVGGCGMDMGFHVVHSLGYALFGEEAEHGTGKAANALRKAIYKADKFYWHQGGKTEVPDFTKPGRKWFAGAGYALKHRWL